jgi:hypothetical protein
MTFVFFIPLTFIALFEAHLDVTTNRYMRNLFAQTDEGEEDDPNIQNPSTEGDDADLQISRVPFDELLEAFPDTHQVCSADGFHITYSY